jgi:hypothetical protein
MSNISLRLPNSLHQMAKQIAQQDQVSLNQFIASAVAEKISALTTESYLAERATQGDRNKFLTVLASVPAVEPEAFDRF